MDRWSRHYGWCNTYFALVCNRNAYDYATCVQNEKKRGFTMPVSVKFFFIALFQPYRHLNTTKKTALYFLFGLYSFLLTYSLGACYLNELHVSVQPVSKLTICIAVLLWFLLYVLCFIGVKLLLSWGDRFVNHVSDPSSDQSLVSRKKIITYAVFPFAIFFMYFLAFYPAVCGIDGIYQWNQVYSPTPYNDWHPVTHTLVIKMTTLFWHSPAAFALFQMTVLSVVLGYFSYVFEKYGVHRKLIWLIVICASLLPINGIYAVTMWKDILYSIMVCLFTVFSFQIIHTNGKWLKTLAHSSVFFITACAVVLFRHNGIYVLVAWFLLMLFRYRKKMTRVYVLGLAVISLYVLITGPVYDKFKVNRSPVRESLSVPLQQMAAMVVCGAKMNDEQSRFINKLIPLHKWSEVYNPYLADPIKNALNQPFLQQNQNIFFKNWFNMVINNPLIALQSYLKLSCIIFQIVPDLAAYTSTAVLELETPEIAKAAGLSNLVIFPKLTKLLTYIVKQTFTVKFGIIWRPALYFMLILLFMLAERVRGHTLLVWSSLPILLNTLSIAVALPAQDFRYLYATLLTLPVLFFITLVSVHRPTIR